MRVGAAIVEADKEKAKEREAPKERGDSGDQPKLFSDELAYELPEHGPYEHAIDLEPDR